MKIIYLLHWIYYLAFALCRRVYHDMNVEYYRLQYLSAFTATGARKCNKYIISIGIGTNTYTYIVFNISKQFQFEFGIT